MKNLNNVQMEQLAELGNRTTEEFANLMLKYTSFVSNEQLEDFYNQAMELESEDCAHNRYDVDYYSVASEYCELDNDTISQAFGYYGGFSIYMDDLGQGLIVSNYY